MHMSNFIVNDQEVRPENLMNLFILARIEKGNIIS